MVSHCKDLNIDHSWTHKDLTFEEVSKIDIKSDLVVNGIDVNVFMNDVEQDIDPQDMVFTMGFKGRHDLQAAVVIQVYSGDNKTRIWYTIKNSNIFNILLDTKFDKIIEINDVKSSFDVSTDITIVQDNTDQTKLEKVLKYSKEKSQIKGKLSVNQCLMGVLEKKYDV